MDYTVSLQIIVYEKENLTEVSLKEDLLLLCSIIPEDGTRKQHEHLQTRSKGTGCVHFLQRPVYWLNNEKVLTQIKESSRELMIIISFRRNESQETPEKNEKLSCRLKKDFLSDTL